MLDKSRIIVLSSVKYRDNSLIVNSYTEKYGRRAFIVNSVHGKGKAPGKAAMFRPLSLLDVVFYSNVNADISRIKEVEIAQHYNSLHFDPLKQSITLYISELLLRSVKEMEANPLLFSFLENSIYFLDLMQSGVANFHLIFTIQLSRFLGFYPANFWNRNTPILDYKNGIFRDHEPMHNFFLPLEESRLIGEIQQTPFHEADILEFNRLQRGKIIEGLMCLYRYHLGTSVELKSLPVLSQLFE